MTNAPNSGPGTPPPAPQWNNQPPRDSFAPQGYGGFWLRVVAYIVDAFVLAIPTVILGAILGMGMHSGAGDFNIGSNVASLIIGWLYFSIMESSERGATLGKMAVGLRVVTDRGERLSFANATGRYFAKFISVLIAGIGFIMVAFTDKKRGLHDMIASTLVVKVTG